LINNAGVMVRRQILSTFSGYFTDPPFKRHPLILRPTKDMNFNSELIIWATSC
jgi:hypothetical protein